MNVYVFSDPRNVGRAVMQAAINRRHKLVTKTQLADVGYVRTMNYGPWRELSIDAISHLNKAGVPSVPGYHDSLLYDDKIAQLPVLRGWMPQTTVHHNRSKLPMRGFLYPFISKTSSGSASKNVRLICDEGQAANEIAMAFGVGIPCVVDGRKSRQRGYLYWQQFIPDNPYDIRVVVNGDHLYGLRRFNRSEDQPFASGSGKLEPIDSLLYPSAVMSHQTQFIEHLRRSFELAHEISLALGTRWACYDFVRDWKKGITYALEVSFSWSEPAYAQCRCFDRKTLEPNGRTAAEWPEFAVDEMERIA